MGATVWNPRWAVVVLLALFADTAPATAAETVEVTVVAILATERNQNVDPKLGCIAREVRKREPKLTGYRFGKTTCKRVPVGGTATFPLVEGKEATVTVRSGPDKDGWVKLTLKPPRCGEITYLTACEKYFPILTRCQTKDRDRVIIAIMVQPCKPKK